MNKDYSKIFALYASLLEQPTEESLSLIEKLKGDISNEISLEPLEHWLLETSKTDLSEKFTNTFDLKMVSYPYAGYHLFGESFKRGEFLSKLIDRYRKFEFPHESLIFKDLETGELTEAIQTEAFQIKELPDHVKVILCFLAHLFENIESEMRDEIIPEILTIIDDCLIPTVNDMLFDFGHRDHRDPMKSSAFFEKSNCAESLETLLAKGTECGDCTPSGTFTYQETESNKKTDEERSQNKDNPYVVVLESLLNFLEEAKESVKGEEPCLT